MVAEARAAGVDAILDVGMGLEESAAVASRAAEIDGVRCAVGIHPNDLSDFAADPRSALRRLRELASAPRVVAVGETGLDFYRDRSPRDLQEASFRAHIALAKDLDRTLVIHCRDAHARVLEVLDEDGPPARVVMHCFSGDTRYARACAERGFFCSFAGNVTYRRSQDLRAAAAALPAELVLAETDAPYLAPHPFRGRPNAPKLLPYTIRALADARGASFDALAATLRDNSSRAFAWVID